MEIASTIRRRGHLAAAGLLVAIAMVLFASAPEARASTSPYCGNVTLQANQDCTGALRRLYAVYGWGDQAGVCVSAWIGLNLVAQKCTSSAATGVYNPFPGTYDGKPWIKNNSGRTNTVHGVAYQP